MADTEEEEQLLSSLEPLGYARNSRQLSANKNHFFWKPDGTTREGSGSQEK